MEIMLGIFGFLLILLLLVLKHCKDKGLKATLVLTLLLIMGYMAIVFIDMNQVNTLKEPIFAKKNGHIGTMLKYEGLGYEIGVEKERDGVITKSQMTMFGELIAGAAN